MRPPVTGVGHYTYHLLEQFVASDDIGSVDCFTGSGWQSGAAQLAVTREQFAAEQVDADAAILPELFSAAAVFAYPSVYEGFGLPVLDAMASGVPVVCRAGTSMAEFSAGNCVLCDSGEAQELATKLENLLDDASLRESWGARGLAQSATLTWERCAQQVRGIYSSLL